MAGELFKMMVGVDLVHVPYRGQGPALTDLRRAVEAHRADRCRARQRKLTPMAKLHVSTTINGEPMEFLCEPNDTMLDALRGPLALTGSKEGCASGDCGACSITVDDRLVCSCLMLAAEAEGHEIRTIEGMADGDKLHPLQQKFLEMAALQCGICTSGMLVASDALLRKNPQPSEEEVRFWLAGNLCRCTGYDKIVRAVLETAAEMREAAQ
jgi:carbon-monoxide dehydrogenase small subunit